MKKQNNQSIKAHLVRSGLYVLLLVAVCVIPFALAQRRDTKRAMTNPAVNRGTAVISNQAYDVRTAPAGAAGRISQVPLVSSGPSTMPTFSILPQPKLPKAVLYDQYNNPGVNATSSQDFEAPFDTFEDF